MIELLIAAVFFAAMAMLCLFRLIIGPTAADRLNAADSMDLLVACSLALYSLYSGRGIYLDVAIITAMLGIINTMLVGRYLDKGRWISYDESDN